MKLRRLIGSRDWETPQPYVRLSLRHYRRISARSECRPMRHEYWVFPQPGLKAPLSHCLVRGEVQWGRGGEVSLSICSHRRKVETVHVHMCTDLQQSHCFLWQHHWGGERISCTLQFLQWFGDSFASLCSIYAIVPHAQANQNSFKCAKKDKSILKML